AVGPVRADDASPGFERGEDGRHQSMDVKERHDVQAAIVRTKLKRPGNVARRSQHVAAEERYELRSRARTRGVEQERNVATGGAAVPSGLRRDRSSAQLEQPGGGVIPAEPENVDVCWARRLYRRAVGARGDHDGLCAETAQTCLDVA